MSQEVYTEEKWNTKLTEGIYLRFKIELLPQTLVKVSENEKKREEEVRNSLSQLLYTTLH